MGIVTKVSSKFPVLQGCSTHPKTSQRPRWPEDLCPLLLERSSRGKWCMISETGEWPIEKKAWGRTGIPLYLSSGFFVRQAPPGNTRRRMRFLVSPPRADQGALPPSRSRCHGQRSTKTPANTINQHVLTGLVVLSALEERGSLASPGRFLFASRFLFLLV